MRQLVSINFLFIKAFEIFIGLKSCTTLGYERNWIAFPYHKISSWKQREVEWLLRVLRENLSCWNAKHSDHWCFRCVVVGKNTCFWWGSSSKKTNLKRPFQLLVVLGKVQTLILLSFEIIKLLPQSLRQILNTVLTTTTFEKVKNMSQQWVTGLVTTMGQEVLVTTLQTN